MALSKEEKTAYGALAGILLVLIVIVVAIAVVMAPDNTIISSGSGGAMEEKFLDPSIPKGENTLVLIKAGTGNSTPKWCIPTFYAYRLVSRKTGGYGELSPWSRLPVISDPSVASPNPDITPDIACAMILPTVGFQQSINIVTGIIYNVHRQTSFLDPTSGGTIIGILSVGSTSWQDGSERITYHTQYTDGNNPNTEGGSCSACA